MCGDVLVDIVDVVFVLVVLNFIERYVLFFES